MPTCRQALPLLFLLSFFLPRSYLVRIGEIVALSEPRSAILRGFSSTLLPPVLLKPETAALYMTTKKKKKSGNAKAERIAEGDRILGAGRKVEVASLVN